MSEETPNDEFDELVQESDEVTAEFTGILKLGDYELPCYVLSNRKRVVTMREVVNLLTGNRKGGLDRYTKAYPVRDYMPPKFVDRPHREVVIHFRSGNYTSFAYEAEDIIAICEGYLKAREEAHKQGGVPLHPKQEHLAAQAEIFIRACAKVGLVALIDEATGYQAVRDSNELQVKLAAYIAKDLSEWTRTFPTEFFDHLYRLEGIAPPVPRKPYPKRFGRYVMEFVYDTLDPDVADWLREHNPNPEWERHHFQWLTADFGKPKLQHHLNEVIGIMKASTTLEKFKENLNHAYMEARERRRKRLRDAHAEQVAAELAAKGLVQLTFL